MRGPVKLTRATVKNLRAGKAQKLLAGATAATAVPVGFEIYINHYAGSFGNKWMWTPVLLSPVLSAAGVAGVVNERAAKTVLPALGSLYIADGLAGLYFHLRGVQRKPGGFKEITYNLPMGPPALAPGALAMIGGLAVGAAIMRRED